MSLRPLVSVVSLAFVVSACAGGPPVSTAPTGPRASDATAPANTTPGATTLSLKTLSAPPADWHRLSPERDSVLGTGSERALRELLRGVTPQRRVIVAVIDGGVDTAHVLLKANLWHNTKEVANGKDDDGNGLVDDVVGWNFVGGNDLKSVNFETLEVTRMLAACTGLPAGAGTPKPDAPKCAVLKSAYDDKKQESAQQVAQVKGLTGTVQQVVAALKPALNGAEPTRANVTALSSQNPNVVRARSLWLQLDDAGFIGKGLDDTRAELEGALNYGFDLNSTVRSIVGDDVANVSQKVYGNRDVTGPDAKHGTHVAGIIAAARGKGDVQGIAPLVQIMAVRAVPNGDERDKDVANAIRYAADNGANIVNMSFGKPFSSAKPAVDEAVRYAQSKGVLFVHAAGNDGENIDTIPSFPNPFADNRRFATTWIEVGASSWKGLDELAADFSNYGRTHVDLFAPGVDILSTVTGGGTARLSGTSMAAPVVSGVAALLMSYFPALTAADIKDILIKSSRTIDKVVAIPGGSDKVKFGALSQSGAIIDAYAAVKMAQARGAVMKQ